VNTLTEIFDDRAEGRVDWVDVRPVGLVPVLVFIGLDGLQQLFFFLANFHFSRFSRSRKENTFDRL